MATPVQMTTSTRLSSTTLASAPTHFPTAAYGESASVINMESGQKTFPTVEVVIIRSYKYRVANELLFHFCFLFNEIF